METTYTYDGVNYSNHNEVPFDATDLKFIKQLSSWGKPDRLKDKRANRIQHCYAVILKKGITSPQLPDKRWLDRDDYRLLEYWLELPYKEDIKAYLEPLKVAKTIYNEQH